MINLKHFLNTFKFQLKFLYKSFGLYPSILFNSEYLQEKAIINYDDVYGQKLINSLPTEKVWTYSVNNPQADFYMSNLEYTKCLR